MMMLYRAPCLFRNFCSAQIQLHCLEIRIDGFVLCYCLLPRNTSLSTSAFTAMKAIIQHLCGKSHCLLPRNTSLSTSAFTASQQWNMEAIIQAPFSSENFWLLATVALSFLFGKNCPIMDYLGLKDSSHDFSANCVISFFFVYI